MTYLSNHNKADCCGCQACSYVCPKHCITMVKDNDGGYLYPQIKTEMCISCHLCEQVCPINTNSFLHETEAYAYVGTGTPEQVFNSASGGAATILSDLLVNNGFVIYGAAWHENLKVVHKRASNEEECKVFRKSKYVQSDMSQAYGLVHKDLLEGRNVLFIGLPCQVAAIRNSLKNTRKSDNLYTVQLLCHGITSQYLFDEYIKEQEIKNHARIVSYQFKNKRKINGIANSRTGYVVFDNEKTKILTIDKDPFINLYYNRLCLRPSCSKCHFVNRERVADLTLADAWSIDKVFPNLNPLEGVSLIITSSEKGVDLLNILTKVSQMMAHLHNLT